MRIAIFAYHQNLGRKRKIAGTFSETATPSLFPVYQRLLPLCVNGPFQLGSIFRELSDVTLYSSFCSSSHLRSHVSYLKQTEENKNEKLRQHVKVRNRSNFRRVIRRRSNAMMCMAHTVMRLDQGLRIGTRGREKNCDGIRAKPPSEF